MTTASTASDFASDDQTDASGQTQPWDQSQTAVIRANPSARLIVEAGPGTGKTAVSCARLNHLVSVCGVAPHKAWMISFTRTAVAEIRSRLHAHLGEAAASVKIATVDSHAWAIHSGFEENATLTGTYEANIQHVLDLVQNNDEVAEYLEGVQHLLIDEAQDFVGIRADLIEAIVARLDSRCGITVLADEAQAIYGFSEDDGLPEIEGTAPILQRLESNPALTFTRLTLDTVHRTSSPGLLQIFSEVRKDVLKPVPGAAPGLFGKIREAIARRADASDLNIRDLGIASLAPGSLVLFRTRAESLLTSQFCTVPHSLRLSGTAGSLPAWLALCFHDFTASHMNKQEFTARWLARVENRCPPEYGSSEAWDRLVRIGGSADGSIDMRRLRIRLGRHAPPVEIANKEFGLPGPVIGTIHASKGREADEVLLLVSEEPKFKSPEAEDQETRVLFVGSTRARKRLRVGKAATPSVGKVGNGRIYSVQGYKSPAAMIEIGRPEDLFAWGVAGTSALTMEECLAAQTWLAENAGALVPLKLQQDADRSWKYRALVPDGGKPIATLSNAFLDDMWTIANNMSNKSGKKLKPSYYINHVRMFGSRSICLAPDDPQLETLHAPWKQSGFLLAPRIAAYTKAYLGVGNG